MTVAPTKLDVVIIGAGFSGIGMAIRLKRVGIDSFLVLEKADDVGGVWRENIYPGAACDAPSHLYSYSFEPHFDWSRTFAPQAEILAYIRSCAIAADVHRQVRFGVAVRSAVFDEASNSWRIGTEAGAAFEARFLISAVGQLHRPKFPNLPGAGSFAGRSFHSAQWDSGCDLEGKNVAVIGTGPSAVQIVPAIAPKVGRLFVFQRSPGYVRPKPDRPYGARELRLFRRVPFLRLADRAQKYCMNELRYRAFTSEKLNAQQRALFEGGLACIVPDPALRARLTPDYPIGCKRALPSNDWYPALQRDNVELVTAPIDRIVPDGIVTGDGDLRRVDVIICATGFRTTEFLSSLQITGVDGRDIRDVWKEGAEAHLGITVHGFPNMFILHGPNTTFGHTSVLYAIESQINYVLQCIRKLRARRLGYIHVKETAQANYNAWLHERLGRSVWAAGCTSWFKTTAGKVVTNWPGFSFQYRNRVRRVRLEDYDLA